ncbi:AbiJ-NTD4 domain-containing protein [Burkholderia pyrrocinia]|uniref:AbiJ-NTD4 domain-containing protein n=1 Tax=Burkholderia pyrrocinia TaxID=60550 RepID=UPI0030D42CB7
MSDYFSDRENGPRARTEQTISPQAWGGVVALVQSLINSGAFGLRFPERCPDGQAICGCDTKSLEAAVLAEMPGLSWPLETTCLVEQGFFSQLEPYAPATLLVLDFIEFTYNAAAKPIPGKYHDFFSHHHLSFDQEAGQDEVRASINRIFARNGLAYEMLSSGRIVRILPPVLGDELKRTMFCSGDRLLDNMLEECRVKFSDRNPLVRREALERLWDAWERLKSLADPTDKRQSVKMILDSAATEPSLRARLETEAQELTSIGNSHLIRHSEVSQVPVIDVDQVDYLFHRLFAMIQLMLRKK